VCVGVCVCGCVCVWCVCVCVYVCVCVSAVNNNETIHLWHTRWEMRASLDYFFPAVLLTDQHGRLNPSDELDGRLRRQSSFLYTHLCHTSQSTHHILLINLIFIGVIQDTYRS